MRQQGLGFRQAPPHLDGAGQQNFSGLILNGDDFRCNNLGGVLSTPFTSHGTGFFTPLNELHMLLKAVKGACPDGGSTRGRTGKSQSRFVINYNKSIQK